MSLVASATFPGRRARVGYGFGALVVATTLTSSIACTRSPAGPVVELVTEAGKVPVRVELARTRDELSRGLMWRDQLDEDAGMLFIFPASDDRTFWMKNTPLPLDIIFIDEAGKVVNVAADTKPFTTTPIRSDGPARYVLEVNAGFARRHGIVAGTMMAELPGEDRPRDRSS